MPIPKKIFQTARSYDALPAEIKENIARLRGLNSDWEYSFFDDDALKKYLRDHLKNHEWAAVEKLNPRYGVVLADIFRYLVIYNEGGVYLDVKVAAERPLEEAIDLESDFLISQWRNRLGEQYQGYGLHPELAEMPGGEFQQWIVVAAPRHPFLRAVIQRVLQNITTYTPGRFGSGYLGVLRVSGPIAYTQAIIPLLDHYPHTVCDIAARGIRYSLYDDDQTLRMHQSALPGHYTRENEPIVLRDSLVEPRETVISSLGELLAKEVRRNTDLILKLAIVSFASTLALLILVIAALSAVVIF